MVEDENLEKSETGALDALPCMLLCHTPAIVVGSGQRVEARRPLVGSDGSYGCIGRSS